ncbi:hypothetical protein THAOC_34704 [Thalassiosira oceanica]|uniref:Alpha-ketoglutarate-dependent dioxygenase FTO n=1 Tax=Thalassiosira oceanica TaxID=159749 RepID=K0R233_THAOC|nr:hypothetical protein THAOC_34704 [Thalassiosira oceanica]|eukprot:EJK46618.1 hypothetical protein THAOC_34704 [Thalassiosira oceanica]
MGKSKKRKLSAEDAAAVSISSKLKKLRGVAKDTKSPPAFHCGKTCASLSPSESDGSLYEECLSTSYSGFRHETVSSALSCQFDTSLEGLDSLYQYDVVQPGKFRMTKTSVTRTLVGNPGSTYKYLGLRLFSHPWSDVDERGERQTLRDLGYSEDIASALLTIGRINTELVDRTNTLLKRHVEPLQPVILPANFSLTLINKMEPSSTKKDLKRETLLGGRKISVGWHRDSGLKDFSSICVYQTIKGQELSSSHDWGVALRTTDHGGPTPPLVVPLPSGSLYYMCSQEAVAVVIRLLTELHVKGKVRRANGTTSPDVRESKFRMQAPGSILETKLHPTSWIDKSMYNPELSRSQQSSSNEVMAILEEASESSSTNEGDRRVGAGCVLVTEDLFDLMIEIYSKREETYAIWQERYSDPIFKELPPNQRPRDCPVLDKEDAPRRLSDLVRQLRSRFVGSVVHDEQNGNTKSEKAKIRKKEKRSSGKYTKKEAKGRASNWLKLKADL